MEINIFTRALNTNINDKLLENTYHISYYFELSIIIIIIINDPFECQSIDNIYHNFKFIVEINVIYKNIIYRLLITKVFRNLSFTKLSSKNFS